MSECRFKVGDRVRWNGQHDGFPEPGTVVCAGGIVSVLWDDTPSRPLDHPQEWLDPVSAPQPFEPADHLLWSLEGQLTSPSEISLYLLRNAWRGRNGHVWAGVGDVYGACIRCGWHAPSWRNGLPTCPGAPTYEPPPFLLKDGGTATLRELHALALQMAGETTGNIRIPLIGHRPKLNRDAMRAMANFLRGIATQIRLDVLAMAAWAHETRKSKTVLMPDIASLAWSSQVRAGVAALNESRANVIRCDSGEVDDWEAWR